MTRSGRCAQTREFEGWYCGAEQRGQSLHNNAKGVKMVPGATGIDRELGGNIN